MKRSEIEDARKAVLLYDAIKGSIDDVDALLNDKSDLGTGVLRLYYPGGGSIDVRPKDEPAAYRTLMEAVRKTLADRLERSRVDLIQLGVELD